MSHVNVLVTGAGSILAQGIIKSLRLSNNNHSSPVTYRIFSADISPQAAGLYRADMGFLVPPPTSAEYSEQMIKICRENAIKAVFVGTDEEIMPLAILSERIRKESDATLITNPESVLNMASDKWTTYEYLRKNAIACPQSVLPDNAESLIAEFGYPIVVKPREGHGSLHFYLVKNHDDLKRAVAHIREAGWQPILQEYLDGSENEFTTGVTVSKTGFIMSSISMKKILKNGQTYKAFIDDFELVTKPSEKIAKMIGARGPVNIQAKIVDDEIKVFEINARFSATCPLRAVAGINEPDIVFRNMVLDEEIKIASHQRLVCMRYWNEAYVPMSTYEKMMQDRRISQADAFVPDYF